MFSGIIEAQGQVLSAQAYGESTLGSSISDTAPVVAPVLAPVFAAEVASVNGAANALGPLSNVVIEVQRPISFDDLKTGDSIAVDGVCLTLEKFDNTKMQFSLGPETLKITSWNLENLKARFFNLERSMRLGERIHGHLVSGHVDTLGRVESALAIGAALELVISLEQKYRAYFPKKASWAVAGVSLTINDVQLINDRVHIASCLIPETLKRTNLGALKAGNKINIEIDFMVRTMLHSLQDRINEREFL